MTFNDQVSLLRGTVIPKKVHKKKADCTPEEWAAGLDYVRAWQHANPDKVRASSKAWSAANPQKKRAARKLWQDAHPDKASANKKAWAAANPDKVRAQNKAWAKANPDKLKAWKQANPQKVRAAIKAWADANPDKVRAIRAKAAKKRYKNDLLYRIVCNLRTRQWQFFKGKTRSLSMVRDMGCTQEFFMQHIASQLTGEMTMENHGTVWHLDHIYPLSKASIVDNPVHFLAAANWRNLQPLPGPENLEKSDEVTPEAQALFDSLVQQFTRKVTY